MKVVFLEDVTTVGHAGDIKEVKDGYARNYLIPRKLAAPANPEQLKRVESIKKAAEARRLKEEQDLKALAQLLSETPVGVKAKAGPAGRFYGAITSAQIAEELSKLTDRPVDKRIVELAEPIHEAGEYQIEVKLHPGITATVKVVVEAEQE